MSGRNGCTSIIEIASDRDDQVTTGGPITLKDLSPPRLHGLDERRRI
jgi:hypothetical protein